MTSIFPATLICVVPVNFSHNMPAENSPDFQLFQDMAHTVASLINIKLSTVEEPCSVNLVSPTHARAAEYAKIIAGHTDAEITTDCLLDEKDSSDSAYATYYSIKSSILNKPGAAIILAPESEAHKIMMQIRESLGQDTSPVPSATEWQFYVTQTCFAEPQMEIIPSNP